MEYLYHRYTESLATREEVEEFFELVKLEGDQPFFQSLLSATWDEFVLVNEKLSAQTAKVIPLYKRIYKRASFRIAAAVIIFALIGTVIFLVTSKQEEPPLVVKKERPADIPPGSDKAILTLADGSRLVLDSTANGVVTTQAGTKVIKINGQLSYSKSADAEVVYNTITVPRKGKYQLVLADGTRVWLDAESSLRFPTAFKGSERVVELTGQGYFEVMHNSKMPFKVVGKNFEVEDIGTAFNINAYDEPSVTTTLVEGSARVVSINNRNQSAILKAGEQVEITHDSRLTIDDHADLEQALAWKNGLFNFKSADLRSIMNQVVRWYDVDVVYGGRQNIRLSGYVSRDIPLSQTLELLKSNGVHFRREADKIIMLQ